jgi:hypothetical protein
MVPDQNAVKKPGARLVNSSLIVCGCGRSGTTIMGKLIGSCAGVEYLFDPPFVHSMIYYIDRIDSRAWAEMMESYLYSDFFLNALAGRNLNFNTNDDSCIYNIKSREEIAARLGKSFGRNELARIAEGSRMAFKVTDLVCKIGELKDIYPGSQVIAMYRNPVDTINSILEKKWFTDDAISVTSPEPMNFRLIHKGKRIPFWVEEKDYDFWMTTTEVNRAAYYFIATNEILYRNRGLVKIVDYDKFVQSPSEISDRLLAQLNLQKGYATQGVIDSISPRAKKTGFLNSNIIPEYQARVREIEKAFAGLSEF